MFDILSHSFGSMFSHSGVKGETCSICPWPEMTKVNKKAGREESVHLSFGCYFSQVLILDFFTFPLFHHSFSSSYSFSRFCCLQSAVGDHSTSQFLQKYVAPLHPTTFILLSMHLFLPSGEPTICPL